MRRTHQPRGPRGPDGRS